MRLQGAKKLEADGVPASQLFAGDILEGTAALKESLEGANAMIIATSAIPEIKTLSLIRVRSAPPQANSCCGTPLHASCITLCAIRIAIYVANDMVCILQVFWKKLLRQEGARPDFKFKKDQYPEQVECMPNFASVSARIMMSISPSDLSAIRQSCSKT